MIRETRLSTTMPDEDDFTEPPSGTLRLVVTGDTARLDWAPTDEADERIRPPTCSFRTSARSLLLALQASWDDNHPGTASVDGVAAAPATRRAPRAPNSHQPWTAELDGQLRDTWLAAATGTSGPAMIADMAKAMGRSRSGIRARLARVGCDPDVPGRTLTVEESSTA